MNGQNYVFFYLLEILISSCFFAGFDSQLHFKPKQTHRGGNYKAQYMLCIVVELKRGSPIIIYYCMCKSQTKLQEK